MSKVKNINQYPPKICNFCRIYIELDKPIYMYLSQSFCSKKCRTYFNDNSKNNNIINDEKFQDHELIKDDLEEDYFNDCYLQ